MRPTETRADSEAHSVTYLTAIGLHCIALPRVSVPKGPAYSALENSYQCSRHSLGGVFNVRWPEYGLNISDTRLSALHYLTAFDGYICINANADVYYMLPWSGRTHPIKSRFVATGCLGFVSLFPLVLLD